MPYSDIHNMAGVLIIQVALLASAVSFVCSEDPTVKFKDGGDIIGKSVPTSFDGKTIDVHQYLGIPFAEPPVGNLRFRKPEMKTVSTPFYAQQYSPICHQLTAGPYFEDAVQSEDCLYLNVFVPNRTADSSNGHAVLIWVYGGGFTSGGANIYDASFLAPYGNIIVVTFNYRVGVYGFLSTDDEFAQGNYGLWDQRLVFQWVQDNIKYFGGDVERVTIAGQSAGAISATMHGLNSDNYGLFHRIIAQSGTALVPGFQFDRDMFADAKTIATMAGCEFTSSEELVMCLRYTDTSVLNGAVATSGVAAMAFYPRVDKELVRFNPQYIDMYSDSSRSDDIEFFRSLDVMNGFNADEGASFLPIMLGEPLTDSFMPSMDDMRMYIQRFLNKDDNDEIVTMAMHQYTNWSDPYNPGNIRQQLSKFLGDTSFCIPSLRLSHFHQTVSYSSNYMYHFMPVPTTRAQQMVPSWSTGATHSDEVQFVFGAFVILPFQDWEVELSKKMVMYWSNFVKSGNPNYPVSVAPEWPSFDTFQQKYIEFKETTSASGMYFYAEEANFWMNMYPKITAALENDSAWCPPVTDGSNGSVKAFSLVGVAGLALSIVLAFMA